MNLPIKYRENVDVICIMFHFVKGLQIFRYFVGEVAPKMFRTMLARDCHYGPAQCETNKGVSSILP